MLSDKGNSGFSTGEKMKITSIGKKIQLSFTLLICITFIVICAFFVGIFKYEYGYLSKVYLEDVTCQTTNNLEDRIKKIEDSNIQVISNSVIQKQLASANKENLDPYTIRDISQTIERELVANTLYGDGIISMSIVSKSGIPFVVSRDVPTKKVECAFSENEIYEANGASLWRLIGTEQNINIGKAILDLSTLKPLGYISIVYNKSYFENIVRDNSTEYSGASFVVDEDGIVTVSNRENYVGRDLPMKLEDIQSSDKAIPDMMDESNVFCFVGDKMDNDWVLVQTISEKEFNKKIYRVIGLTTLVIFTLLLASILLIRRLTMQVTKPTQELLHSMKMFGRGDLTQRVSIEHNDEIGQIGREYNRMAESIETQIEKIYKLEITQKQAEIDFLSMQINPHFLYNALDTISWMAIMEGSEGISEMTIALADLLRAQLKKDRFISIGEEIKTVKDYLYIQKERFGDHISVEYVIDEMALQLKIPNFILQPLIENAIVHGLEPKIDKGLLKIEINQRNGFVHFIITDNGVGMEADEIEQLYALCRLNDTNQNIGLKNVYRRLLLCYGEKSELLIESEKNKGTKISFCIPVETEDC